MNIKQMSLSHTHALLGLVVGLVVVGSLLIAPLSARAQGELLSNPGFESGALSPWVFQASGGVCTASIQSGGAHSGSYYARYGSFNCFLASITQQVTLAVGTYTLSVWSDGSAGECEVGYGSNAHLSGGTFGQATLIPSSLWTEVAPFTFTLGTAQTIYVGVLCTLDRGFQNVDDFSLVAS